jgi:hypothetical protein
MARGFLRSVSVQLVSADPIECEKKSSSDDLNLICNEIHRRVETFDAVGMIIPVLLIDTRGSSTNILSMEGLTEELTQVQLFTKGS